MESLKGKTLSLPEKYKAITKVQSDKFSVLFEKTFQSKKQKTQLDFSHRYKQVKMTSYF